MSKSKQPKVSKTIYNQPKEPAMRSAPVQHIKPVLLTPDNALMTTLDYALGLMRPHNTVTTRAFTQWLHDSLRLALPRASFIFDSAGNVHIDMRTDHAHKTLFVAHVDTVHRIEGLNKIDKTTALWRAGHKGQCLGADDGAGVAILVHLMCSGVPGYYIFTQGEEVGGIGAKYLARDHAPLLAQFDRAIAFDRKGMDSVITHQGFGRCCSDEFANALADALTGDTDTWFLPDDTGVYTDTAEFVDVIPECTNISVGYSGAHGDTESLDTWFLQHLAQRVVAVAWDSLPTTRDPKEPDPDNGFKLDEWDSYAAMPEAWRTAFDEFDKSKWGAAPTGKAYYKTRPPTLEDEVEDAIADARIGLFGPLMTLIAEVVYPEDPSVAKGCISKRMLTDEVLDAALDALDGGYNAETVLEDLFYSAQPH